MLEYLTTQLQTNQFFSGMFVTGAIAGTIAMLRSHVIAAWKWILRVFRVQVRVHSADPAFPVWLAWAQRQKFDRFTRTYRTRKGMALVPDYGTYCVWYGWRPLWITVEKLDVKVLDQEAPPEQLTVSTYSCRRSSVWLRHTLDELTAAYAEATSDSVYMYRNTVSSSAYLGELSRAHNMPPVLPEGVLAALEADIDAFLANRGVYARRGVPWRRGYLFHGVPGSGKTSLIRYLSRKYAKMLYLCEGSAAPNVTGIEPPYVLVFEDIDCRMNVLPTLASKADDDASEDAKPAVRHASLGDMLNSLDGIVGNEGTIIIMTTNHRDRLDPALIRPGRIDYEVEFGYATEDQWAELCRRFFPDEEPVPIPWGTPLTMATVQNIFQSCASVRDIPTVLAARGIMS